ncbi:hypothetical protein MU404_16445 [Acinetobacter baumannii]|uniref:hypothetical protein n=1 Tax=Acinetobacter baumannii TaxID=470 RepID=UPI0020BF35A7|nr:hypothetical protein [Acinetobacter baumannii]MCL6184920.1 hypothetical protein [Acinetobacter baumannii]MCL6191819.1 hypothetical protein [Acinetobacter baumannii]
MEINKYGVGNINGNGNTINNGDTTFIEAPKPRESIMCSLLTNIANMIANRQIHPELPDNLPYNINDKIIFNKIEIYNNYYEYFEDGLFIIEDRLKTIEDSSIGNIKPQIFRYVQGFFIRAKEYNKDYSADEIISCIESAIISDLKTHYFQVLSPEDLSHVQFVIYYVFASCKIFSKPTNEFIKSRNANSQ